MEDGIYLLQQSCCIAFGVYSGKQESITDAQFKAHAIVDYPSEDEAQREAFTMAGFHGEAVGLFKATACASVTQFGGSVSPYLKQSTTQERG